MDEGSVPLPSQVPVCAPFGLLLFTEPQSAEPPFWLLQDSRNAPEVWTACSAQARAEAETVRAMPGTYAFGLSAHAVSYLGNAAACLTPESNIFKDEEIPFFSS